MAENNENTKNTVEETGTVDTQTTNQNEGKAFKTFQTEEEYQNAVDSILKTKLPSKDEMNTKRLIQKILNYKMRIKL